MMSHEVVLENHLTESTEIPPCAMYIDRPDEAMRDTLLICSEISTHHGVSDLWLWNVTCNSLEAPRLTNPVAVYLDNCLFPDDFVEKIHRQLFSCGETLQKLWLCNMSLRPF